MSAVRPGHVLSRCVSTARASSRAAAAPLAASCRRQFHASGARPAKKPRFSSKRLEEVGLNDPAAMERKMQQMFPEMTPEALEGYTEAQLEAIRAGEEAVDPRDLVVQGRVRDDKGRIEGYVEDFSTMDPINDMKPERGWIRNKNVQWLTEGDYAKYVYGNEDVHTLDDAELEVLRKGLKMTNELSGTMREEGLQRMVDNRAGELQGAERRAFLEAMETAKATEGTEVDLLDQDVRAMEASPELLDKYVIKEGESEKRKPKKEKEPTVEELKAFDIEDAEFILHRLADGMEKEGNMTPEKLAQIREFRNVGRKTRNLRIEDKERVDFLVSGNKAAIDDLATAPPLPKIPGVEGLYKHKADEADEGLDEEGIYEFTKKATGFTVRDILSTYTKHLVTRHVVHQTRLGKVRSASVMFLAGTGDGRLGIGMAKASDFSTSIFAARLLAIRNMKPIRRYENRTIYGNVRKKISGTVVELRSRPPGMFLHPYAYQCNLPYDSVKKLTDC